MSTLKNELIDKLNSCSFTWHKFIEEIPDKFFTIERVKNFYQLIDDIEKKRNIAKSKPINISIEPTNKCNLECTLCPTKYSDTTMPRGLMQIDTFEKSLSLISDSVFYIALQNWGEPLLHKKLPDFLEIAHKNNIYWWFSTNASLKINTDTVTRILSAGYGKIIFDIDGLTNETYQKYRVKGDLNLVLKNVALFTKIKKEINSDVLLEGRMIVNKYNQDEVDNFEDFCLRIGLDKATLHKLQVNNGNIDLLPDSPEYRYSNYHNKEKFPDVCHRLYSSMAINWDGRVSACCLTYDESSDFAVISKNTETFDSIWNNDMFSSARNVFSMSSSRARDRKETICATCRGNLGISNTKLKYFRDTFAICIENN